jgi:hypothetical protein
VIPTFGIFLIALIWLILTARNYHAVLKMKKLRRLSLDDIRVETLDGGEKEVADDGGAETVSMLDGDLANANPHPPKLNLMKHTQNWASKSLGNVVHGARKILSPITPKEPKTSKSHADLNHLRAETPQKQPTEVNMDELSPHVHFVAKITPLSAPLEAEQEKLNVPEKVLISAAPSPIVSTPMTDLAQSSNSVLRSVSERKKAYVREEGDAGPEGSTSEVDKGSQSVAPRVESVLEPTPIPDIPRSLASEVEIASQSDTPIVESVSSLIHDRPRMLGEISRQGTGSSYAGSFYQAETIEDGGDFLGAKEANEDE